MSEQHKKSSLAALTLSAVGIVYGVDLVGASVGCLVVLALLNLMDAPSALIAVSGIAGLGAWAFVHLLNREQDPPPPVRGANPSEVTGSTSIPYVAVVAASRARRVVSAPRSPSTYSNCRSHRPTNTITAIIPQSEATIHSLRTMVR